LPKEVDEQMSDAVKALLEKAAAGEDLSEEEEKELEEANLSFEDAD
jgi:hypothetical protein